ncbi:TRAP transporter substrate-binding protein [Caldovatus aquaticus]|uniref:TRAP transporter substrate-binding protein n=1 Tax=Caldovatus aquaticus TaxID=2865671 RepID=A0ABS7EZ98_9PROT|nr:TRAP transporter substrate-binding protein [Caldovatus aquaticus]MBW8268692.1 TRAP transporter substrate-binding protein [Caldovatus aquaticus]
MTVPRRAALGGLAALALAPCGAARAQAATRIVINNDTQATSLKGQTWELFKREIEAELGPRVQVQLHHSGTLYDQRGQVQALQLGAIQFIAPVAGIYAATAPKLAVLGLPYLLPTPRALQAVIEDEDLSRALFGELRAKAMEPVAFWLNGHRDVGRRGTPILRPADMRGVKIRVPAGANYVEAFRQLGANVVTIDWGEVPTALAQGVIDAVEPVANAWLASKLYEIANHITRIGYVLDFYVVCTNKAWWERLPAATREAVRRSLGKATEWNWANTERINEEAYQRIATLGATVHALTPEQRAEWREAMRPVWARLGNPLLGEEVMQRLARIGETHG